VFYREGAGRIERGSDEGEEVGGVGEAVRKRHYREQGWRVLGERDIRGSCQTSGWRPEGINQERTSQCSTLPEDIDQEKTGKIMDAGVEDDGRDVLCWRW